MADKAKLAILYATQTGNALDAADQLAREANRRGLPVKLRSIDHYDPVGLASEKAVVFVVSTTGQGDTPDSMKPFWRYILQKKLGDNWLQGVHYAVFGLGDSGYQKYNVVAKRLNNMLFRLGAAAIVERGLGDDQHPCGYEAALDPWMKSLWKQLHETNPHFFPNDPEFIIPSEQSIGQPKFTITYHDATSSQLSSGVVSDLNYTEIRIETARGMSSGRFPQDKRKPSCFLKLIKNQSLMKEGCGRDVRHFEFEFVSPTIDYEVGDNLEVLPAQDPILVEAFMKRCNLDPAAYITVHPVKTEDEIDVHVKAAVVPMKLKSFVNLTMDVASASPRRYFFEVMSHFADAPHEKEKLQYFSSPEGRDDLYQYNQRERRTVLEVLEDFPSVELPFEWLVELVPPLKTRAFSISSSPLAHRNQVHLTVSVVKWSTPFKRSRSGLCSTWLSKLNPEQGIITVPVWFNKGSLPRPPSSVPLVLVGPGTGCAPFRGFVAERAVQSAAGEETAAVMLFFGCRNEESDFLYREFWLSHTQNGGVLSECKGGGFFVAFSRDQQKKIYVQHKIRENRSRVWDLLSNEASIYVAGSSTKMPSDVLSAFEDLVSEEIGVSREDASKWVKTLEKAGRYHVEAWS